MGLLARAQEILVVADHSRDGAAGCTDRAGPRFGYSAVHLYIVLKGRGFANSRDLCVLPR